MEKRFVKKKQSNSEINDLPDPLLCHILSFLPTRDSVRSSLLSKRWRSLWLQVPVFDLDSLQFDGDVFGLIEFVDRFLESDENLALNRFKLIYHYEDIGDDDRFLESWIDALVRRRVRHLDFQVNSDDNELVWMPLSLYLCNTLVSLSLYHVALSYLEPEFVVSLPCLKVMHLDRVRYDKSIKRDESNLETLITSCPVLEKLTIIRDSFELLEIISVRSKSLKSFALVAEDSEVGLLEDHVVEIDAPKLERMSLCDHLSGSVIIHCIAPFALVNIDVNFDGEDGYTLLDQDDDSYKRTMIGNFLTGISTVSGLKISSNTMEEFEFDKEEWPIKLSNVPPCFVSSLKYVELSTPVTTRTSSQVKLAIYFLRNCAALKKLSLSENFGDDIIKKIKKIPRRSRRCSIVTG
ncbi:hypothetical protein F2Q68_00045676 [Brassica cretica]|uniref:F-box domain-containing protein n=1 Tax=Brassica cretica TaxID=69181 RepID=A0A8S9LTZ3_BRACR|nr:hypothetical protein F2Q68_00045676 [Brassica cretica]